MKRFVIPLACTLALTLGSCGGQTPPIFTPPSATVISAPVATGTPSNIEVVNRGVAAAGQTLTLLMNTARAYTDLPRCGTGPRVCSDRETVRQIRRHATRAHNAYVAARQNEAMVEHAWTAINAFRAVVPAS